MRAKRSGALLLTAVLAIAGTPPPAALAELPFGPAPRTEDGRFENLEGPLRQGGVSVRFPFFLRRFAGSFRTRDGAPPRVPNDGAFLRENALHSEPIITWIGHATVLVQMDHVSFLTDPIWSRTASPFAFAGPRRFVPPGVALDALPPIDFVVISHNHYDHLDLGTLEALADRDSRTRFLVPLGNGGLLREHGIANVEELDWGETRQVGKVSVHCLPARHWSQRGMRDRNRALWSSWAVVGETRRFYYAGDSGYSSVFARIGEALGPFDLVAVPIGAYRPVAMMQDAHMNPEQALRVSVELQAARALGVHFGTFDLTDEPLAEPAVRFRAAGERAGLAPERIWILAVGETRNF